MHKFLRFLKPKPLLCLLGLVIVFLSTRLINLSDSIPVFVDEAIYVRWAQVMRHEPTLRFLPLSDGKQPLFMWAVIPFFKIFSDPLFAGRFVSVLSGLGTMFILIGLTFYISESLLAAFLAALLYTFTPFTLFFDRMALVDSTLSFFGLLSFFIGLLFVRYRRLDLSLLLGMTIGLATLTKSPGWLFLAMQPLLLITHLPKNKLQALQILGGWLIAAVIAFVMYNILRLGPNFHLIASRNLDYVFPLSQVFQHPLNPFLPHFKETLSWMASLLTWPASVALIFALFRRQFGRVNLSLFLWALLPLLFQASVAKAYTSRYFLYTVPPLLTIIALNLSSPVARLKKGAGAIFIAVILLVAASKSIHILIDPTSARLPQNMQYGYFQEWTAGYGQKQTAAYLKEASKNGKVLVGTEGYFGTLPDGLLIYTQDDPNITVLGVGQPVNKVPEALRNSLVDSQVFLVVNSSRDLLSPIEVQNNLKLVLTFDKPSRPDGSHETLRVYQLLK